MLPPKPDYGQTIERLFPQTGPDGTPKRTMTFTFQVTNQCSLCCTYCYQINKGHEMMPWDVAKRAVDYIFDEAEKPESIFSYDKLMGFIVDFIGGEPLLNIDLVVQVIQYFEEQLSERNSPWQFFHRYSFSTNGVSYFDPRVQDMLAKYGDLISMGVTVDGYEGLHDKCRLFPDGSGSYKLALAAALDQKERFGNDSTKITLCPENVMETSKAIINMLELGFRYVHANCVFEEGWELKDARILYDQMKIISDYVLGHDLEDACGIALYNENDFTPIPDTETANWCGGTGKMLAVDYKGDFYPCLRYMESSVGSDAPPLIVGNLDIGAYQTPETRKVLDDFQKITRQSQSTQECLDCPIARGCAWCSAYNYQKFGTANHRATFICVMHKARALANWYYWKKEAKKKNISCKFAMHLPEEEAVRVIGRARWDDLLSV